MFFLLLPEGRTDKPGNPPKAMRLRNGEALDRKLLSTFRLAMLFVT